MNGERLYGKVHRLIFKNGLKYDVVYVIMKDEVYYIIYNVCLRRYARRFFADSVEKEIGYEKIRQNIFGACGVCDDASYNGVQKRQRTVYSRLDHRQNIYLELLWDESDGILRLDDDDRYGNRKIE